MSSYFCPIDHYFRYTTMLNTIIFDLGGVLIDWNPAATESPPESSSIHHVFGNDNTNGFDQVDQQAALPKLKAAAQEFVPQWQQQKSPP